MVVSCLISWWYFVLFPACISASLYGVIEFLNISSLADDCGNLNSIDFGSCLIMDVE